PPTSDEFVSAQRDWYLHAIDCFGPARCMFESNFPVDRVSLSYVVLYNGFKKLVADFSPEEKQAMFHDNANAMYALGL
ncbi:MAG: amidohydrolase family protein, partial [Halieaceae bacterium]|nr:amidohydrolase family protein [Halieaceae bacterium]